MRPPTATKMAKSACAKCRSRTTCAMLAGGQAHHTFQSLNLSVPSASTSLPPKSVHRRELPEALTAFSSERGRRYFTEAMALGHMEPYFPLIEQFVTQEEVTFCGLGTLTMVMNALRVDPRRRWRDETGPGWRWWSDEMFPTSCTGSLDRIRVAGVTMEEFHQLASANGASVRMQRATDEGESLESFRTSILDAATSSQSAFTVTSFDRASLGQTGALRSPSTPPLLAVARPAAAYARRPTRRPTRLQVAGISRPLVATTPPRTPPSSSTLRASSTPLTGCRSAAYGKPRSCPMRRQAAVAAGSRSSPTSMCCRFNRGPTPYCREARGMVAWARGALSTSWTADSRHSLGSRTASGVGPATCTSYQCDASIGSALGLFGGAGLGKRPTPRAHSCCHTHRA